MIKIDDSVYELAAHIPSSKTQSDADRVFKDIRSKVKKLSSKLLDESSPSLIPLAYEIKSKERDSDAKFLRYNEAYFFSIKAKMDASSVGELDAELKSNGDLLRYLLFKTVKEDTRFEMPKSEEKAKVAERSDLDQVAQDEGMDVESYVPKESE